MELIGEDTRRLGGVRVDQVTVVTSDHTPAPHATAPESTFSSALPAWLGALANVRNVVRQEMISRPLACCAVG